LLFLTGFRKGEALNLEWKNIDFDEKIIKLWNEKDNRNDVFPLFAELESFLLEFRSNGKVFSFVGSNHIAKILKREFNISFKDFRSTFASNKAKDFKSFELKELLRHKKVTTTEQYYVNIDVRELGNRL
jgi:integrase